jgi:AraC-like DNA-binding protein
MMKYAQIPPPASLENYVQYFWTLESDVASPEPISIGPLADGCPGLMFQNKEIGIYFDQYDNPLSEVFIYGQTVKRTYLYLIGKFETIGVCFFPYALKSVFGFDADSLTDSCLNLSVITSKKENNVTEQLLNSPSVNHKLEILSLCLSSQAQKNGIYVDSMTSHALSQIIHSKGNISLPKLHHELKISERSMERKFKQHVGVSPKLFSKILRFKEALKQLKSNNYDKLSDIAYDLDYSDQSHFIRVFKEFTGLSPFQFQKQSNKSTEDLPEWLR